jgi:hypothetical protein
MQTNTQVTSLEHRTGGAWTHTGLLIVRFKQDDGSLDQVTLPGDLSSSVTRTEFDALTARVTSLEARVAALEARPVIDAIEDLKYGN